MQCDHSKDADIKSLFERIEKEQNGRLDLLVNNAYSGVNVRPSFPIRKRFIIVSCRNKIFFGFQYLVNNAGKKFHELDTDAWDIINNVGLR